MMDYLKQLFRRRDHYRLAVGLKLKPGAIVDSYLGQRHRLRPKGYFILHHMVEAHNSPTATAVQMSRHYKNISYDEALDTVRTMLKDLSAHFIVEPEQGFARRQVLTRRVGRSFLTILQAVVWCQWPLFLLISASLGLSLAWLGVPLVPETLLIFMSLVLGTATHEFGHYWPLIQRRRSVILIAQRGRVSVVYPARVSPVRTLVASLSGPLLAMALGLLVSLASFGGNEMTEKLLALPVLLCMLHGGSLLFGQQDGQVLQNVIKRKRLQLKEVDMQTLLKKLTLSLGVFLGLMMLFTLIGFIFAASVGKGYVGVKSFDILGLNIMRLSANGKGFELSNGSGLLIVPLLVAIGMFAGSLLLDKVLPRHHTS